MTPAAFRAQFPLARVREFAARYDANTDLELEHDVALVVRRTGFYTRAQLLIACAWKSPRTKPRCEENTDELVREATGVALSASEERMRIGALLVLRGVSWPTASVLLHFGHSDRYPILDVRALEALGTSRPRGGYSFEFWWAYVDACRQLADRKRHATHASVETLFSRPSRWA